MKTTLFVLCILVNFSIGTLSGQNFRIYPIPSFNVFVEGTVWFQETVPFNSKAKRVINVHIYSTKASDSTNCSAEVLIYSLDHQDVLGPYTVNCGETLSVEIDDREWGVSVTPFTPVEVSVWVDLQDLLKKMTGSLPGKEEGLCNHDQKTEP